MNYGNEERRDSQAGHYVVAAAIILAAVLLLVFWRPGCCCCCNGQSRPIVPSTTTLIAPTPNIDKFTQPINTVVRIAPNTLPDVRIPPAADPVQNIIFDDATLSVDQVDAIYYTAPDARMLPRQEVEYMPILGPISAPVRTVPEPGSLALMLIGLPALALARLRK